MLRPSDLRRLQPLVPADKRNVHDTGRGRTGSHRRFPVDRYTNRWAGYAACAWAMAFASMSFYWAAGGTAGADTLGPALSTLGTERNPAFVALLWLTGVLKVLAGLLALALVRLPGRIILRRVLLTSARMTSCLLFLYGGASWLQHGLMVAHSIPTPLGLGRAAALWHFLFWDPWWMLGGILFGAMTWQHRRAVGQLEPSSRPRRSRQSGGN